MVKKVGNLIEFTRKGVFWNSWEGRLNMTQTGMNTSGEPFSFSFDNDRDDQDSLITLMKQAQVEGWKLKIKYHEVWGLKNCFYNRGETDYFVDDVTVLDKDFANPLKNIGSENRGSVVDTVWVVIDKDEVLRRMKKSNKWDDEETRGYLPCFFMRPPVGTRPRSVFGGADFQRVIKRGVETQPFLATFPRPLHYNI